MMKRLTSLDPHYQPFI